MSEQDYRSAAVCRRGHVETSISEYADEPIPDRCSTCGATILTQCEQCGARIRGSPAGILGGNYSPPDFCNHCGTPFPWLSREGRIYLLENLLDDAGMGEAERLRAHEQLEALTNPELDEREQARLWTRFRQAAPNVWSSDAAQKIISTVVEAGVRGLMT